MDARYAFKDQVLSRLSQEQGTLTKDAPLKVALCYPSPYFVGMSSLGYQTIYRELNALEGVSAERSFLPDDIEGFRKARLPLFTYEGMREVASCDVVAFSVAYELELTGIFTMLELSGLPVLREDRNESHPLVVAGGPLTFSNAEPLEPFVDVVVQGEAEELVRTLVEHVAAIRSRPALLSALAKVPGLRVPGVGGERFFVAKASDDCLPARSQIVTADTELRSMFLIEPERGCSRGCHYCVMRRTTNGGMRTIPPELVLSFIPDTARRVGLVGAAVTDHPRIVDLLKALVDSGREVGVSSLRADRLTQPLVDQLRRGGAQGLTVASDGSSQKMRDLIDRKHSEEQILRAARYARTAGMEKLKVYNMVGLPYEDDSDIDELVRFTTELSRILPVALGVAPFVAKRNTPLDGAPFAGVKEVEAKLERLRKGLRGKAVVRPTSARWAWVEYMLAQCGPEAGLATLDAYRAGSSFGAYRKAFKDRGARPFLGRRVEDGRRKASVWPVVEASAMGASGRDL
jgi:radical SAM superfamily enzyme YgiQ (UPF0313 family)